MQTITQDPNDRVFSEWWDELVQTHAGVPPGAGERTFAYLGFRLGCHTSPQSSCTEKSYDWIPVSERLPEYTSRDDTPCVLNGKPIPPMLRSEDVLVLLGDGRVRVTQLITLEGSPGWFDSYIAKVTHWRPLPPPPETKS